jgi:hypothetical protein
VGEYLIYTPPPSPALYTTPHVWGYRILINICLIEEKLNTGKEREDGRNEKEGRE